MSSLLSLFSTPGTVKPKPRKTTKPTAPPTEDVTVTKPNDSPSVEGFQTARSFPTYGGPSIYFQRTMMDIFYQKYNATNLQPNPDLVSLMNSVQVQSPDLPNYGAMLSNFDAGSITGIPWDADNATSLKSDIVWGHVTLDASKSIFSKVYHQNLLSDPNNLTETEDKILYNSVLFSISASSPGDAMFLQMFDAVGTVAGQMTVDAASNFIGDVWKVSKVEQMVVKLNAAKVAAEKTLTGEARALRVAELDIEIDKVKNANKELLQKMGAIDEKVARDLPLTNDEKLLKAASAAEDLKKGKSLAVAGEKASTKLGIMAKFRAGIQRAKFLAKSLKTAFGKILTKVATKFFGTFMIQRAAVSAAVFAMNALGIGATVASLGVAAPLEVIIAAISIAWEILDIVCMVLSVTLMILLPSLLDKALENGGVCSSGKPIDQIISDEFLYFLFTTFCPIGGLMDVFGPYVCYSDDGQARMKDPLYIPAYFSDTSLSIYKHNYTPQDTPRGESTSFENGVPRGTIKIFCS